MYVEITYVSQRSHGGNISTTTKKIKQTGYSWHVFYCKNVDKLNHFMFLNILTNLRGTNVLNFFPTHKSPLNI